MSRKAHAKYQDFIPRFQEAVRQNLPPAATVLVVSKGDSALLDLDPHKAWHFPQREDGAYLGYHPADSATAIAHLESLRHKGAEYLVFPQTAFWWLEHYGELRNYAESHYTLLLHDEHTCMIFALRETEKGRTRDRDLGNSVAFQAFTHELDGAMGQIRDYLDPDLLRDLEILFDLDYYREQTGAAFSSFDNALSDYLERGCTQNVSPNVLFDPAFYLDQHPEVRLCGANPLLHFLSHSVTGLQNPGPYFDTEYYYSQTPGLREKRVTALVHYLKQSAAGQASKPNPLFDNQYYLNNNPEVPEGKLNPLVHYVRQGCDEGRFASQVHHNMVAPLLRASKHALFRDKWKSGSVLLFSYGESRASTAALAKLAEVLERDYRVDCLVLLFKRQETAAEFETLPRVLVLGDYQLACSVFLPSALRLLVKSLGALKPLFALTEAQEILAGLKHAGILSFYFCPEFADRYPRHILRRLLQQADHVIYPSSELLRSVAQAAAYDPTDSALRACDVLTTSCSGEHGLDERTADTLQAIQRSPDEACVASLLALAARTLRLPGAICGPVKPGAAGPGTKVIIPCSDWSVSGVNSSLEALSLEMIRLGWDVQIVFTREKNFVMESVHRDEHFPGLPHTFLQPLRPGVEGMWEALIAHVECQAPSIMLMAYDFLGNSIAPALSEKVGVISWVQADEGNYYEQTYRLGRYCNAVVCVSERIKSTVAEHNPMIGRRAHVIHNSSVSEREVVKKKSVQRKKLRLIYTGRLVQYQKRVLDFIDLACSLDRIGVAYELTLIGEFSAYENIHELFRTKAKEHLKDGRIRLPGRATRTQILKALSEHDIFLLLSDFEGFPLSLVEAMARGCVPVVAEMESGIGEVITSGKNGLIVNGRDYSEWARLLAKLWKDRKRVSQLSKAACKTVQERFTVEHVASQFDELFRQVAEESRTGEYARPPSLHPGIHRSQTGDVLPPPNMSRGFVKIPGLRK